MKKRMRKLMCLALVCLMTVFMVVPAMAESRNGTGVYGQYNYSWSLTRASTSGTANMVATTVPVTVGAAVQNYIVDEIGQSGYAYSTNSSENGMVPVQGYVTVNVTAGNRFKTSSGAYSTGTVKTTHGYYYINSTRIGTKSVL